MWIINSELFDFSIKIIPHCIAKLTLLLKNYKENKSYYPICLAEKYDKKLLGDSQVNQAQTHQHTHAIGGYTKWHTENQDSWDPDTWVHT